MMNILEIYSGVSNFVKDVDDNFMFILGVSVFFLIGLTVVMVVFVVKYNRKKHAKAVQIKDNMWLEMTWTVIPLILVLLMFYYGYVAFKPMRDVPEDAMVVKTIGRMWQWQFTYPDGRVSEDLVIPINKPVKLEMTSEDVIHSLFIPAFRVKEDLVPGQETYLWFLPEQEGEYEILCTEYCGLRHSYMEARARVVTQADYDQWLAEKPVVKEGVGEAGLDILKKNGCISCHSLDGAKLVGPSFKNLYGYVRKVNADGKLLEMVADADYIHSAIMDPNKEIVEGYNKGLMQPYDKLLTDDDVEKIVEYLKTITDK